MARPYIDKCQKFAPEKLNVGFGLATPGCENLAGDVVTTWNGSVWTGSGPNQASVEVVHAPVPEAQDRLRVFWQFSKGGAVCDSGEAEATGNNCINFGYLTGDAVSASCCSVPPQGQNDVQVGISIGRSSQATSSGPVTPPCPPPAPEECCPNSPAQNAYAPSIPIGASAFHGANLPVGDQVGFLGMPAPHSPVGPPCCTPAGGGVGGGVGGGSGAGGGAGHACGRGIVAGDSCRRPPNFSIAPIRYSTGEVVVRSVDLAATGFGIPWGHTRGFASRQSQNEV